MGSAAEDIFSGDKDADDEYAEDEAREFLAAAAARLTELLGLFAVAWPWRFGKKPANDERME